MTILLVENNPQIQEVLVPVLNEMEQETEILAFQSSPQALVAARNTPIDIAFLDVKLPEMDGFILGRYLRDLYPMINLIYLTDAREDAFEAMCLRASGCLLLPAQEAALRRELKELRYTSAQTQSRRVFAQTFGNFELFVDDRPVTFKYSRTKEVVALLVNNRGAQTTNGEIIATLWEDEGDPKIKGSYLSNLRQDLQNTFTRLKINDIILKQRGSLAIATDRIECDLYDFLDKKEKSRYRYMGDYMNQYSWSDYYHAELDNLSYHMQ